MKHPIKKLTIGKITLVKSKGGFHYEIPSSVDVNELEQFKREYAKEIKAFKS